jgi:hypothetical protein
VGELYALRFDADLVTLSACETALGKVESGDDVVGSTRAFLYAGTNAVISTLWSVDDRATFRLRYYCVSRRWAAARQDVSPFRPGPGSSLSRHGSV